ncbi:hypothetical protein C8J57DRAFT_1303945 [Mycena rebaudengoi]|nr:hypothetical protein C8J57DRAFT_1303945 [Mycena rebaudengoi]
MIPAENNKAVTIALSPCNDKWLDQYKHSYAYAPLLYTTIMNTDQLATGESTTSRDSLIYEAISGLLKIDPPDLDLLAVGIWNHTNHTNVPLHQWVSKWEILKSSSSLKGELLHRLRACHEDKKYQPFIDKLMSLPSFKSPILDIPTTSKKETLKHFEDTIEAFRIPLRQKIGKVVSGERTLQLWSPKGNDEYTDFLRNLKIPIDPDKKPDMLLYDLGGLRDDPDFRDRLRNLFEGTHKHKFLLNTSGSGKTRLVFEGLCQYWGLYFTALKDTSDHGSMDLQTIIDHTLKHEKSFSNHLPDDADETFLSRLETNGTIAESLFQFVLLARLFIFQVFVEAIPVGDNDTAKYKKRWLELQVKPAMLDEEGSDIFHDLSALLVQYSSYIGPQELLTYINTLVQELRKSLKIQELYLAVDEIQHTAENYSGAFRSENVQVDGTYARRPVFRPMLFSWLSIMFVYLIVTGTGVSGEVIDETMRSAVAKYTQYDSLCDTGVFSNGEQDTETDTADDDEIVDDNETVDDDLAVNDAKSLRTLSRLPISKYIEQFLPPNLVSKKVIQEVVGRVAYWLSGRFRFSAGYISELLAAELKQPHEVLNAYILELTRPPRLMFRTRNEASNVSAWKGFIPTDCDHLIDKSARVVVSKRKTFNFKKLKKNKNAMATINQIACRFWMRCELENSMVAETEAKLVEWGFARFLPSERDPSERSGRMDEPMALLALGQWFNAGHHQSLYHQLAINVGTHNALGENTLENYLAFCFTKLFGSGNSRLDEIFNFPKGVPAWANQTASLVSLYRESSKTEVHERSVDWMSRPSYSVGTHASTYQHTLDWVSHRQQAPICFPANTMGPDLLFAIRLKDGRKTMGSRTLRDAIRSVTPINFFSSLKAVGKKRSFLTRLSHLPDRIEDAGKYSLLRVIVSFPGETRLVRGESLEDMEYYDDDHPIASLNMVHLGQVTKDMEPRGFLDKAKTFKHYSDTEFIDETSTNAGDTNSVGSCACLMEDMLLSSPHTAPTDLDAEMPQVDRPSLKRKRPDVDDGVHNRTGGDDAGPSESKTPKTRRSQRRPANINTASGSRMNPPPPPSSVGGYTVHTSATSPPMSPSATSVATRRPSSPLTPMSDS